VLLPDTVAEPTKVPLAVHDAGGVEVGPNTVKVMVPVALEPEVAARAPLIELAVIEPPAVPVAGAVTLSVGEAGDTIVSDIPDPQALKAELLLASPPYEAYHQ
jgi:hypothetical protein